MKLDIEKRTELIAVLIVLAMLIQLIYLIDYQSLTNDEFTNIAVGKYYIANQDFSPFVFIDHPPLGYLISSLFLYFGDNPIWSRTPHDSFYIIGNNPYSIDYLLFITRLPVALTAILLGIYIFKWTKELYGKKAALLALFLFSFEPNILAYFSIATTDFVMTAFIFISLYYFWKFQKEKTYGSALKAGIFLGLALISKHPALILIPFTFTFLIIQYKRSIISRHIFPKVIIFFIAAFIILWAIYGFHVSTILNTVHSKEKALDFVNKTIKNDFERNIVISSFNIPIPAPYYITALGYRMWQKDTTYYYFFGEIVHGERRLDYYPLMFLVKTPIPFLILLGIFILRLFFMKKRISHPYLIFGFVLTYFVLMGVVFGPNLGLRHMLPIYPFLFVLGGSVINIKFKSGKQNDMFKAIIIILLIWYIIEALLIIPHNISYFNQFIGPDKAWLYFADSDIDIGQELKEFRHYIEENNISHPYVPIATFNMTYDLYLNNYSFAGCEPKNGTYGMQVTQLTLFGNRECYSWMLEREPNERIGYSFFIYNVRDAE